MLRTNKITPSHAEDHHLTHPKYRADIDGLRAIAVFFVIGFHAFPDWVKGGFVGVDVFFVISGFLISSIIFSNLDKGTFSFTEFYARRIKRIFPALILVMAACYALGWFQLLADEYKQLGKHIAAGAGFVSNFIFWQEAGYFDNTETKLMLHLWSLGVEEQFYIVWPPLLYFAWKMRFNLLLIVAAIALVSFALNIGEVHGDAVAAFYSPVTRFWELLVGSLLAYTTLHKAAFLAGTGAALKKIIYGAADENREIAIRNAQSTLGVMLIGIAVLLVSRDREFPGWWALLPTLGACLIISAGPQAWLNRIVLSHRVVVWFGLISYPLYLWHWPLLSFPKIIEADTPSSAMRIAAILLAIALAWLTYKLVEKPIRFGARSRASVTVLCLLMLVIGYVGYAAYERDGYGSRLPKIISAATKFNVTDEWRLHKCFLEDEDSNTGFIDDCLDRDKKPLIFLWGDSYAAALYPGLKALKETRGVGIAQFTASACPPLMDWISPTRISCKNINDSNLALIKKIKPDIVLLHSDWAANYDVTNLDITISELKKTGIQKIILLGPVPVWKVSLKRHIFDYFKNNPLKSQPPLYIRFGLVEGIPGLDQDMRAIAQKNGVSYISAYEAMCNSDGCLTRVGEEGKDITSFDDGHLSQQASRYFINRISGDLLSNAASR